MLRTIYTKNTKARVKFTRCRACTTKFYTSFDVLRFLGAYLNIFFWQKQKQLNKTQHELNIEVPEACGLCTPLKNK